MDRSCSQIETLIKQKSGVKAKSNAKKELLLVSLMGLIGIVTLMHHFYSEKSFQLVHSIEVQASVQHELLAKEFSQQLQAVIRDTSFLTNVYEGLLENSAEHRLDHVKEVMYQLARAKPFYSQIRLIDDNGDELVRIQRDQNDVSVVASSKLQNKLDRYYFQEGMALQENEVYISRIDLNVERGEIERPYNPTMRFVGAIHSANEKKAGLVVINYDAKRLLDSLDQWQGSSLKWSLVDSQGYWLKASDPEKEWGFMFAERQDESLAKQAPKLWQRLQKQDGGHTFNSEGLHSFNTIDFQSITSEVRESTDSMSFSNSVEDFNRWKLISLYPQQAIVQQENELKLRYFFIALIVFALLLIVTFQLYKFLMHRSKDQMKLIQGAYTNNLTQAYNRKALMEYGEKLFDSKGRFLLFYFDLDRFKPINDEFGHEAGDEILKIVVKRLYALLREETDSIFRLGGDEFVILVNDDLNQEQTNKLKKRVISVVEKPININGNVFDVGISIGFCDNSGCRELSEMLDKGDQLMYEMKKAHHQGEFK